MSSSKPVKFLLILILLAVLLTKTRQHCETISNKTYLVRKDNAPAFCNCREDNLNGCAVQSLEYPDYYACTGLGVYETIQCCEFKHLVKCCNGWARLHDSCSLAVCSPPCLNGGFCIAPQTCSCRRGFQGSVCQTPNCRPLCENGGSCVAPDTCNCKHGYTGPTCSNGICDPTCLHGGVCVAPQLCKCRPGYYGRLCERGDELTTLFTPTLYLANAPSSTEVWYKTSSTYSKACFLKIYLHVNDSSEILTFTSESFDDQGRLLGNYTAIALDEKNSLSGPLRSVCLDVKCPDEQRRHMDTIKVLTQANTNLRYQSSQD
uniref:Notch homolog 2 N-terminal-like protein isoform X2 n=1 Tax=Crassostrea virginica TaxID=6565 RepID=A0A8B8AU56_CRAVI|nr:notch homolog 2 N-terminal-like protein isoform X2 [Crassostrea virginica]